MKTKRAKEEKGREYRGRQAEKEEGRE